MPPEELIRESIARICASAEFSRSKRMIALLGFLVDSFRNQHFDKLNERAIGEAIFDRAGNWDPSTDTIVRSEVRRLRSKLDLYYQNVGSRDTVRIAIPKGAYTPKIEWLPQQLPTMDALSTVIPLAPPSNASISANWTHGPWTRFRPRLLLALSLPALVLIGLGIARTYRAQPPATAYDVRPFTSDLGEEFSPAISPDGQTIAYVARPQGLLSWILIKRVTDAEGHPFTPANGVWLFPAWSPDGSKLAYDRVDEDHVTILVRPIGRGPEQTIANISKQVGKWSDQPTQLLGDPGPAWTTDGKHMIVSDGNQTHSGLFILDMQGHRAALTQAPGESRDFSPRVSPDGRLVAFIRYFSHGSADIYTIPLDGGNVTRVTADERDVEGITWEAGSKALIASSNRGGTPALWRIPLQGKPSRLAIGAAAPTAPSLSARTGAIAFVESSENWNVWRYPLSGASVGKPSLLLASSGRNYDARYSGDGQKIAFISDRSGTMQLWIARADGSDPVQQTRLAGSWMGGLSWSPDGQTIAFDARPEGHSAIFFLDVASGSVHSLQQNKFEERMPSFSRDGKSLYFNSTRGGTVDIWRYEFTSKTFTRLPSRVIADVFSGSESFDGGQLIYGTRSGALWSASPVDSIPHSLPGLHVQPSLSWITTPSGVYFIDQITAESFKLCTGTQHPVCSGTLQGVPVTNVPDIAISPDSHWLLLTRKDISSGDIKLATPSR